jgi:prepilin-type N-terminal cleavage/methylation domain-containing protein
MPMMTPVRQRSAFTLVELLIVIGIIAILALIALPNFLEAQVRAKVARAKSDMRSLATAVEAYAVDNNRYAPPVAYLGPGPNYGIEDPSQDEYRAFIPPRVTTPVAYISSLVPDAFWIKNPDEHPARATYHYSEQENNAKMEDNRESFIADRMEELGVSGEKACRYFLASHGPDSVDPGDKGARLYDATNGSVSVGDLYYFGPGIGIR